MAINFPHNPNVNDVHTEASIGRSWKWDGTTWKIYSSTTTGIAFGDLSVSQQAASGSGSLTYNNAGVFTYTPPAGGGGGGGSSTFIGLNDTPNSLTAGKWLKVNTGGTALEWTDAPTGNDTNDYLNTASLSGTTLTLTRTGSQSLSDVTVNLSSLNSVPTNITVADESTDTECYPLFSNDPTGNIEPKTGSNIKFNALSGQLEAGSFKKTGGTAAEFLKADGSIDSNTYSQTTHTHSYALNDLSDVTTGTISDGDVLKYSGTNGRWEALPDATGGGGSSLALNDLTNVDAVTNVAQGKILKYNGSNWEVADDNASGGGGGATTINNNADNRIITGSASANTLNAESSLTYDGNSLFFSDDKAIKFGSNLRMQMYTDGSINYIKSATDGSGAFPISIHSGSSEVINIDDGNTQIKTGLKDKDGDLGTSGQILSSTGTQVNWIDAPTGGTNTTYDLSGVATSNGFKTRLSGSDSTTDDVEFTPGGGISYTVTGNTCQISSVNTISGLSDVSLNGSPSNGQVLKYNGTAWVNDTDNSGGGADGNDYVTNLSLSGTTLTAEFGNSSLNQSIDLASIDSNTNTTYSISCLDGDNADEEKIRLTAGGSGSSVDDIVLEAGTGLTIARSGDKITFTNSETNTNTTYGLSGVATGSGAKIRLTGSGGATNDVELTASGGISYSVSGNTIQISSLNSLSGLSDTDISGSPSTGDVLKWNGSNWAVGTDNSGGGADGNNYANSLSFNTGNGVLTVGRSGLTDLTVDLDNRYAIGTIPTNNNQLTNGAGYITSSGTAATATNANNVKIRTDNGAAWHYPLYVDSNSDNQNQTLKVDTGGMKYYPSLGWLQNSALQSYYMYDWNASYGGAGQVLTSQGSGQWSWTTPSSGGMTGNSKVTTYTSGNGTHTTQSWCKTVIAALVGAGGGGGNAAAFYDDDDSPTTGYGGGGGSGGVSFYTNNVSGATNISYSVGTGGAAQSSANCDDSPANGAAGTGTGFGGTTAGGGGGGQGVGQSGNGSGGSGGSGNLSGMAGGSGQDNNMRAVTPFFGKYGYGGRGADGSGLTGGDSKCNGGAENGENGAIIVLELG